MSIKYFFLFDNDGKQKTYADDIKGLEDLGAWVEYIGDFDPAKDLARLVNSAVVIDKNANIAKRTLDKNKRIKIKELIADSNQAKKITIKNGKTLVIAHDTTERDIFLKLIEDVSNLSSTQGAAFIYEQQTDSGKLALRILPEIATYIFKDLFVATLNNPQQTKVNSRVHNKTTVYELALENINNATIQAELDAITWAFINPLGIVIDVNVKANEMLNDATVSDVAKVAINAAKDPTTGEIHLVKTLQELAADS
jgi:hypothetical protein